LQVTEIQAISAVDRIIQQAQAKVPLLTYVPPLTLPHKRLPAPCPFAIVELHNVLADLQQAVADKNLQEVSVMIKVGQSHAIAAHGARHDSEKTQVQALKIMERVWPALAAICGSDRAAADALARMRPLSVATRSLRRRLIRQGRVSAMRNYAQHLTLALVLSSALSFQSKTAFAFAAKAATHEHTLAQSGLSLQRKRATVGRDNVRGPAIPVNALQNFKDLLRLDIGTPLCRLAVNERSEPSEGTACVRNLRGVLLEQLQWLFDNGAIRTDAPEQFTAFFRFGGDFGHAARWTVHKVPYLVQTVGLLYDVDLFEPDTAPAVTEMLIWLLARERDELAPVQFYAEHLLDALSALSEPVLVRDQYSNTVFTCKLQV
jgi:hypothetical protein